MGAMDARVLLATFCLMPEGEPGGSLLVDALAERGVEAAWATSGVRRLGSSSASAVKACAAASGSAPSSTWRPTAR